MQAKTTTTTAVARASPLCVIVKPESHKWSNLPLPALLKIFDHLSFSDLLQVRLVCMRWLETSFSPKILQKIRLCITEKSIEQIISLTSSSINGRLLCYRNYHIANIYDKDDVHRIITRFGASMLHLYFENSVLFGNEMCSDFCMLEELIMQQVIIKSNSNTIFSAQIDMNRLVKLRSLEILNALSIELNFIAYLKNLDKCCSLQHLSIRMDRTYERRVFDVLETHAPTLKYLDICVCKRPMHMFRWQIIASKFRNLQILKINWRSRFSNPAIFFHHLSAENPLKFLNMSYFMDGRDFFKFAIDKWSHSLQAVEAEYLWWLDKDCLLTLRSVKHLETVIFEDCDNIRDDSLLKMFGNDINYNMKVLVINQMHLSEPRTICYLAVILPNLRKLSLNSCHHAVTDESLLCITNNLFHLECLVLDGCFYISDNGMTQMENLQKLHTLSMRYCNQITDNSLDYIKLPNLRELNISYCDRIATVGLKALLNNCPSLEILSASSCKKLKPVDIYYFIKRMKRLRLLIMYHCPNIKRTFCTYIQQKYPYCRLQASGM